MCSNYLSWYVELKCIMLDIYVWICPASPKKKQDEMTCPNIGIRSSKLYYKVRTQHTINRYYTNMQGVVLVNILPVIVQNYCVGFMFGAALQVQSSCKWINGLLNHNWQQIISC